MTVSFDKLESEAPGMVSLVKEVKRVSLAKGLDPDTNKAAVVAIFDSSPSNEMGKNRNYTSGLMGRVGNMVLAAGFTFDDDMSVPVAYFNYSAQGIGDITPAESEGLIDRTWRQHEGGGTNYLAALRWILSQVDEFAGIDLGAPGTPLEVKFTAPYPLFAIFVTDGEPTDDQQMIIELIRRMSQLPIFIQFVGVGPDNDFRFLESLNSKVTGRLIDNVGFFNATEVLGAKKRNFLGRSGSSLSPDEERAAVLDELLNEFPSYYPEARQIGLIAG